MARGVGIWTPGAASDVNVQPRVEKKPSTEHGPLSAESPGCAVSDGTDYPVIDRDKCIQLEAE